MKQKTRILIYILIAAAVVIMGVIAVFSKAGGGESAAGHIDLGRTYLIELSYDKAVIEFTEAIRIDPNNVDAYLGLAEAYEKLGDTEKAIEWLEKGFELTGDVRIGEVLDRLRGSGEVDVTPNRLSWKFVEKSNGGHSAAITTDGSLYMWGNNWNGQLGIGSAESPEDFYISIRKVMDNVASVSLGYTHSAAITTDGSLYMWGDNLYGQIGNGSSGNIEENPIKILDNAASVSLGTDYSAAITTDGKLYMWGHNLYGQLGNGESNGDVYEYVEGIDSNVPIKILDNIASVNFGLSHSAAITTDGSLYMWGDNYLGQLGSDTIENRFVPIKILDNVVSASLGSLYSAAITTDGSLYMWGSNHLGELGNGTNEVSRIPIKILDNVASVRLKGELSAAITTDGSLYTWGDNYKGQLGTGKSGGEKNKYDEGIDSNIPIKILDNVASISFGSQTYAAITTDGSLYMWGENCYGQLGNNKSGGEPYMFDEGIDSNIPIKVFDDVAMVSLDADNSAAITTDGNIYTWGLQSFHTPSQITLPTESE